MKLIGLSCVMAGLLLAGCQRPVAQTEDTSTPDLASSAPAAPVASTAPSAPAAPLVVRPSTPPPPEYAPAGVFYLLAPFRKDTKDGIIRLLPGTEVKVTRNGKYMTPEGEMALPANILTNDMAKARAARNADQLAQVGKLPNGLPPISAAPPANRIASDSTTGAPSLAALTSSPPATNNPLPPALQSGTDADIRAIKFRLSVLRTEEAKLQDNYTYLDEKLHLRHHTVAAPSGLNGSTDVSDLTAISSKLDAIRVEIQTLEAKIGIAAN